MRKLHQVTGGWAAGIKLLLQLDGPDSTAGDASRSPATRHCSTTCQPKSSIDHPKAFAAFCSRSPMFPLPYRTPTTAGVLSGSAEATGILDAMHRDTPCRRCMRSTGNFITSFIPPVASVSAPAFAAGPAHRRAGSRHTPGGQSARPCGDSPISVANHVRVGWRGETKQGRRQAQVALEM
jgi:hypothetical protein